MNKKSSISEEIKDLKKIIETSSLILHEGEFVYAKVKIAPQTGNHFLISQDANEITVITRKENVEELDLIAKSNERSLLEIQFLPDSPDASGFLAVVSSALAENGISISVVSTYSKDYIFVQKKDTEKATQALTKLGFLNFEKKK